MEFIGSKELCEEYQSTLNEFAEKVKADTITEEEKEYYINKISELYDRALDENLTRIAYLNNNNTPN